MSKAHTDGHRFIVDALDKASVVLAESLQLKVKTRELCQCLDLKARLSTRETLLCRSSQQLDLLAVTGTNGKTSISDYIGQLLRLLGESAGTIGTLGARTQSGEAVESQNTTPDVISLNRQIANWVEQGIGLPRLRHQAMRWTSSDSMV